MGPSRKILTRDRALSEVCPAVGVAVSLVVALVGCAPGPSVRDAPNGDAAAAPTASKTIILGQLNPVESYGPWDFANTFGGGSALAEVHSIGLISEDLHHGENVAPQLALRVPSFDDGTVAILPDGRMRTTWQLRPNVKWHDGAPFSADDVVFSWQLLTHPDLRSSLDEVVRQIQLVEAPNPLTVTITWRTTYYRALDLAVRDLWLFPRHLLGESFAAFPGRDAFLGQPYFTTEYVNLGPFRLVDFGLGEEQVFERFDQYFLGRPRVDRIILRTINNPNVLLANLKAGAIDVAGYKSHAPEVFIPLRDEWRQTGAGTVVEREDNWRYIWFQFDPQWASPPEISRDVRVRRGLMYGIDRDALREFLLPGFTDTGADSFMLKADTRASQVGQPFARYRHDPARAAQELADAGWQRGGDGRLLNPARQQVQIESRGSVDDQKEVTLVATYWRQLGIEVSEVIPPPALSRDNEYKSKFPAAETRARGTGAEIFVSFDGRLHSTAQNRWSGANTAHYANPELDRLIDRLYANIDERQQSALLKEMGDLMADELPALPLYFRVISAAANRGVDVFTEHGGLRLMPRNAHLWDRSGGR